MPAAPRAIHVNRKKLEIFAPTFLRQTGILVLTPEGGVEKRLGPGGYFDVPGGLKHTSGCAAGAPCLLFQEGPGAFDMKPVAVKGAEKK